MAKTRDNRQGAATRQRLVEVAERLFADRGADAVSVRAINTAAGLGAAAVHHHFGTKHDLLTAVLEDLGLRVQEQIAAGLATLAERVEPATADELVDVITTPFLDLLLAEPVRGIRWVRIVAIESTRSHAPSGPEAVLRSVQEHLRRSFPATDQDRLPLRWAMAINGFLQVLAEIEEWVPLGPDQDADAVRAFHADLRAQTAGGFVLSIKSEP